MSLLSLSPLLSSLFISYADQATVLESTSATPLPRARSGEPSKLPSSHCKRRTRNSNRRVTRNRKS
jgi:hypothetical protein